MRSSTNEFQKDFWEKVGQRIINRRKQLGMTRDQLSDFLQITYKSLTRDSVKLNEVSTDVVLLV